MHPAIVRRVRVAINVFVMPFAFCAILVGCGSKEEELPMIPVSGKVFLGKDPMPYGSVMFFPDDTKGNTSKKVGEGTIASDGTYTLTTGGKDGVAVGWYKVTVNLTGMSDPSQVKLKKQPNLRSEYTNAKSTPISVEVSEKATPSNYEIKMAQ